MGVGESTVGVARVGSAVGVEIAVGTTATEVAVGPDAQADKSAKTMQSAIISPLSRGLISVSPCFIAL